MAVTLYNNAGTTDNLWKFFGETLINAALEEYYPKLVLHDMASHITLPGHRGKKVYVPQWNKVNPVAEINIDATAQGTPGTDSELAQDAPDPVKMTMKNYNGTIQGFGGGFIYSDIHASITEMLDELTVGARQLGGGYAITVEDNALTKLYTAIDAADDTSAVLMGANGTTWTAADKDDVTRLSDFSKVAAFFESNIDGITPTFPDGTYKAIIHPNVKHDLFADTGSSNNALVQWLQTSRGQGMYEGHKIPMLHGIAIETSAYDTTDPYNSHAAWVDTNTDLTDQPFDTGITGVATGYINLFFAPGAWANLSLANATPSMILQPFGSAGTQDMMKREMTVAIKGFQTCVPLDMARRAIFMATGSTLVA